MALSKEEIARKRAEFLWQNSRAIAAHRAGMAVYCGERESVNRMLNFDRLDKPWRDLANEYGANRVRQAIEEGASIAEASQALAEFRRYRQDEWLSTDFKREGGLVCGR